MIRIWIRRDDAKASTPSGLRRILQHTSVGCEYNFDIPLPTNMCKIKLTGKSIVEQGYLSSFHGAEIDLNRSKLPCGHRGWTIIKAATFQPSRFDHSIHKKFLGSKDAFRLHVRFTDPEHNLLIRVPNRIPLSAIKADGSIPDLQVVAFLNNSERQVESAKITLVKIQHHKVTRITRGFTTVRERKLHSQHFIEICASETAGTQFIQSRQKLLNEFIHKIKSLCPEDRNFIKSQIH